MLETGPTSSASIPEVENVNIRKRKRDDDYNSFVDLLTSQTEKTDSKLVALQQSLSEIIAQNAEIKENISFISKKYDEMVVRAEKLEAERKTDRIYINQLEDRVENLERIWNQSKIEIRNVPSKLGETREDLCKLVCDTANILEVPLAQHDIKDVFRAKKKEGVSSIIVDFAGTKTKADMLKCARKFNNTNRVNKLNTTHINIPGPSKPIYVAESLTLKAQRLFYLARLFSKDHNYKFCWTSYGKVFLKKAEGEKQIPIKEESDLNNLRK